MHGDLSKRVAGPQDRGGELGPIRGIWKVLRFEAETMVRPVGHTTDFEAATESIGRV